MIERPRLTRITLVLALVLAAVALGLTLRLFVLDRYGTPAPGSGAATLVGGPFTLIDQDGNTRTDGDFRGKFMLVYFGYSYCPDLCPTELQAISDALEALGDKARTVQPIFITIDPERDTADTMKQYVSHFSPRLIGLTGTPEQVAAVAKAYRVYYAKVPAKGGGKDDYLMDHSGLVYLIGPDGRYLTHFTPQTPAAQMAKAIGRFL
ncbi:MAG TPA: SCO family protein [Alphaproteobacteria bacterium]|nr:SCO family protein [Alphaproteobacteria bacterium]